MAPADRIEAAESKRQPATIHPLHPRVAEAERRQLTVMFCDLVDSTRLSTRLDPEVLREVIRQYQKSCAVVIERYDGRIAQYLGDGILVYYGYPKAHENDAQRAVYSALELLDNLQHLNRRLLRDNNIELAMRVGIHTGMVVVGEIGVGEKPERLAVGTTPNLAARLQGLAPPNAIMISEDTYNLVEREFKCISIGRPELKGFVDRKEIFQVEHAHDAAGRSQVMAQLELTPLIGREREIRTLLERWQMANKGESWTALVSGEAGIGKSRLIKVFRERLGTQAYVWLHARCSPYHQTSAFYPVIEVFRQALMLRREDSPQQALALLREKLRAYDADRPEVNAIFADLLSIPLGEEVATPTLPAARRKERTIAALSELLGQIAVQTPLVVVVEDLHWVDSCTLDLLTYLLERRAQERLLLLLTFRPEFSHAWTGANLTQIKMNRLGRERVADMVRQITNGKALPDEVLRQIIEKTDGVPLFVEELTRMVLESNMLREEVDAYHLQGPLPPLGIPATLRDSLMARLDRLAPAKVVAQLGAAIGREFSFKLLQAVSPYDGETLKVGLESLMESELVVREESLENGFTYLFRHALIQEAAYETLLKSTRQQFHQRIGEVIVERFPAMASEEPAVIAHHFTEAGQPETAVAYWLWAGQQALERSAIIEALRNLDQGRHELQKLPADKRSDELELELLMTLGPALIAKFGYAASEVESNYARAVELCQLLNDTHHRSGANLGKWVSTLLRSELDQARQLTEYMLALAEESQESEEMMTAHLCAGVVFSYLGEFERSQSHMAQVTQLYDPRQHGALTFLSGQDPRVVMLSYSAENLWFLGYPDQAEEKSEAALQLAQQLDHPFTLAFALNFACNLYVLRGQAEKVLAFAKSLLKLATDQEFRFWVAGGQVMMGRALFELGENEKGIATMEQGIDNYQAMKASLGKPGGLGVIAEVLGEMGQINKGLAKIEEAIALMLRTSQMNEAAEIYRIKSVLLHQAGKVTDAQECLQLARKTAREQMAKSLELRVAMSQCRLAASESEKLAAFQVLQQVYDWFTEGFATRDLLEAKAALEQES